jgi:hypothetical protein
MRRTLPLLLLALLMTLPARADEAPRKVNFESIEVTGSVVDANGKSVAGVPVSDAWSYDGAWSTKSETRSGEDGSFKITVRALPAQKERGYRILAADEKRAGSAFMRIDGLRKPVTLTLTPIVAVSATFDTEKEFPAKDGAYVNVFARLPFIYAGTNPSFSTSPEVWVASTRIKDGGFSINLPAGAYFMRFRASEAHKYTRAGLEVPTDSATYAMKPIELVVNPIARAYGKPAPAMAVSYVRNLPEDIEGKGGQVTLADFKGRWVMLEFWGFW